MSNRYHRKPGNRKLREQLIIITEGSLTEVQYIEEICAHFKVPSSLVKIETPSYTNAEGLVKYAVRRLVDQKKAKQYYGFGASKVWVLCDTEINQKSLNQAIDLSKKHGIWLGLSDPCFEFWLLLHFKYTTRGYNTSNEIIHDVQKSLPLYSRKKKSLDMRLVIPNVNEAIRNASLLRLNHTQIGNISPSTDCDLLIMDLLSLSNGQGAAPATSVTSYADLSMHQRQYK